MIIIIDGTVEQDGGTYLRHHYDTITRQIIKTENI